MAVESTNAGAWKRLFGSEAIVERVAQQGFCDIDAETIRQVREPRLMCKIDFREQIPAIFKEHQLSILAIENGLYRIAPTDPFLDIDLDVLAQARPKAEFQIPEHISTLSADAITSESKALDAAAASGMIDFLARGAASLTIRGREFCGAFDFSLPNRLRQGEAISYSVDGVQVEVDGGYESTQELCLIEAKMGASGNMNIRQLLYPLCHYINKTSKPVRSWVMFYSLGGRFDFIPFTWDGRRASLDLAQISTFLLKQRECTQPVSLLTIRVGEYETGFGAPFPQADDFRRVHELFLKVGECAPVLKEELFRSYDLVPRQHDYYANALRWLGLVGRESSSGGLVLTELGQELYNRSEGDRILLIGKIAFSNELFHVFLNTDTPDVSDQIRKRQGLEANSTFTRRCQTVKSWKQTLFALLGVPPRS